MIKEQSRYDEGTDDDGLTAYKVRKGFETVGGQRFKPLK